MDFHSNIKRQHDVTVFMLHFHWQTMLHIFYERASIFIYALCMMSADGVHTLQFMDQQIAVSVVNKDH